VQRQGKKEAGGRKGGEKGDEGYGSFPGASADRSRRRRGQRNREKSLKVQATESNFRVRARIFLSVYVPCERSLTLANLSLSRLLSLPFAAIQPRDPATILIAIRARTLAKVAFRGKFAGG